jgi:hypothetical protein
MGKAKPAKHTGTLRIYSVIKSCLVSLTITAPRSMHVHTMQLLLLLSS